jgi:hypothetical protein
MGTYLAENQVGYDPLLVGFPGLGSCMGCALRVPGGLFGFHIYGTNSSKPPSFNEYVNAHGGYGAASHLYGSCKFVNRYTATNRFAKWLEEMRAIAAALGYHGPASGYDLTSPSSGLADIGSAYLEYAINPISHNVDIRYAHMDQIDAPKHVDAGTGVRVIKPDLTRDLPYLNRVTRVATPKPGASMTTAGDNGFYSVTI